MEINRIKATIEAILFAMGDAVDLNRIAKTIDHDKETTKKIIYSMMDSYDNEDRGIQINQIGDSFQMCTKPDMYESIINLINVPKKHILTEVVLETLSIIAYKQPITKVEIEAIRGVNSDHSVNKLIEYNLVCELGRMDAPGRPILFGTTQEFLRCFGLESLEELPSIRQDKIENFKGQVKEEVTKEYPDEFGEDFEEELKEQSTKNQTENEINKFELEVASTIEEEK